MTELLRKLYSTWENWASTADKSENGWQSDFPAWDKLMEAASAVMASEQRNLDDLRYVEACWIISEETEDLAAFAEEHLEECWEVIEFLANSPYKDVRWQVYSILGSAGSRAEQILRRGIDDPNPYCRRRAILSLSHLNPNDAEQLAKIFLGDSDPYIRLSAIEFIRLSSNTEFIDQMRLMLLNDSVEFVRESAGELATS